MQLNQIILIVAVFVVVGWNIMRMRQVEKLEDKKSEVILYVENSDEPNPFIIYAMAKKMTTDEDKLEKILALATEAKTEELLKLLKTL
jgi:uncharacterized protein YrzB (UPF0473 family)